MKEKEFKARLEKAKIEEGLFIKQANRFMNYRLFVFLTGAIISGLLLYNKNYMLGIIAGVIFMSLFTFVMVRHNNIRKELRRCHTLVDIYEDQLKRISGVWTSFSDIGSEFLNPEHPYGADLNVFGEKSLFQLLNLTHTFRGRNRLAELLRDPDMNIGDIFKRQSAVKELSGKLDFIEELTLRGLLTRKTSKDPEKLINSINSQEKVSGILKNPVIQFALPVMTILSAVFVKVFPILNLTLLSGLIVQLLLFAWSYKALSPHLAKVHEYKNELETYKILIELIEKETFKSELLKKLQEILTGDGHPSSGEIKRLTAISDFIDFKNSPLIYFILNALLLWDLHLYKLLSRWKKDNANRISGWLDALGEFEALISLSIMDMITPVKAYPEFTLDKPEFYAKELSHPYISFENRVPNDVSISGIGIITGSNMSGKTTLLRTVGINLVLAYAGAPVCASSMKTGLMRIYTSMRNHDDLSEGISTFYAELLRIKKIVDYSKKEKNMIFLIDEIFKGTNSKDRIEGAEIVMKGLNKPWNIGFISTHDYELCDLENEAQDRFLNYNFTESYSENRIHFDYKLHPGRAKTSNARYLMKMVGLE